MAKFIKRTPKTPYNSLQVFTTKSKAVAFANRRSKTRCNVVILDYSKDPVPVTTGKLIKYIVLEKANQKGCKKK